MKINTRPFGEVEINEADIIEIKDGIIGFEESTRFVLLSIPEEEPFSWLQSLDEPALAFVVVNPYAVLSMAYKPRLGGPDLEALGVTKADQLILYCIVVVPENPANMTVNLKAPVAFLEQEKRGKQVILLNEEYMVRHRLLEEMQKLLPSEGGDS